MSDLKVFLNLGGRRRNGHRFETEQQMGYFCFDEEAACSSSKRTNVCLLSSEPVSLA